MTPFDQGVHDGHAGTPNNPHKRGRKARQYREGYAEGQAVLYADYLTHDSFNRGAAFLDQYLAQTPSMA